MIVFLNGHFVSEDQATVSVFDRSFQYGDGLFEAVRISNGKPFRWDQHLQRLARGAAGLDIRLPFDPRQLREFATELVQRNQAREAVLRIALSRGVGRRGYSPRDTEHPTLVMSCHPADPHAPSPHRWKLFTSSLRLSAADPLSGWKTCNKLVQILARAEAEAHGADEALLLNDRDEVSETSSGNLFWLDKDQLITPPANAGVLVGITRSVVMELAPALKLTVTEKASSLEALRRAAGIFVTLSSLGVVEAAALDGKPLREDPRVTEIHRRYQQLIARECA